LNLRATKDFQDYLNTKALLIVISIFLFHLIRGNDCFSQIDTIDFNDKKKRDAFLDYIGVYQKYISSIKGGVCPMYPSCSNYGLDAFKTKNPFSAFVLTSDRLLRCGHEHSYYDIMIGQNEYKLLDFLNNTDNEKYKYKHSINYYAFSDTTNNENKGLEFAKYLINNGFYSDALIEINKLLYFKKSVNQIELYTNYIICLKALNELEKIIFEYETTFPENVKHNSNILIEIGNVWLQLENYEMARELYYKAIKPSHNNTLSNDKALMLVGLSFAKENNWKDAQSNFSKISNNTFYYQYAIKNSDLMNDALSQKYKSKILAGFLGVIPGLGYLYASHKQTAISSLLVNSLLMYATYTNYKDKNYGMTALVGTFSLAFYIGNIQGSVKSVQRYNNHIKDSYIKRLNLNFTY